MYCIFYWNRKYFNPFSKKDIPIQIPYKIRSLNMVGKFICKIEMVRRKAQLKSEVESVVPYTVVQEITAHCERVLGKHSFRSCKSDEVVVMVFLHYATHEKDTFASIECDFGFAHTNFNHDFYTVLQCT